MVCTVDQNVSNPVGVVDRNAKLFTELQNPVLHCIVGWVCTERSGQFVDELTIGEPEERKKH